MRVLDVPVALAARPWTADGDVVLEVTDAQGHAAGSLAGARRATASAEVRPRPTTGRARRATPRRSARSTSAGPRRDAAPTPAGSPATEDAVGRFAAMADLPDDAVQRDRLLTAATPRRTLAAWAG